MDKAKKFLTGLVIAAPLSVALFFVAIYAQFIYQSRWGDVADFKTYQSEFVLVKDYMAENVPQGKMLYISQNGDAYDLYDFDTKQYLNCPEAVQTALATIVVDASTKTNNRFDHIRYENGKVSFHTEAVAYAIVYSPDEKPRDVLGDYVKKVRCKRITADWYHVVGA